MPHEGKGRPDQFSFTAAISSLNAFLPSLKNINVLSLANMGPELAEGCKGDASPSEWRTEPLWGLRFVSAAQPLAGPPGPPNPNPPPPVVALMHDGRAASIDEAIQMHGGEGEGARYKYNALSQKNRDLLLEFLNTL